MCPEFREFLTCLDTTLDPTWTLCAKLEETLFGCHVSDSDDNTDSSELSGFLSSKSESDSEPFPAEDNDSGPSPSSHETPSKFTWRNVVCFHD